MIRNIWLSGTLWLLGLLGAVLFGYSLTQQTRIQLQMNNTMRQINDAIITTGRLVDGTAGALGPLVSTTKSLNSIESKEQTTVSDINSMNQHLSDLAQTEAKMIQGLDSLNKVTQALNTDLPLMANRNSALYETSSTSTGQAKLEAGRVGQLNALTSDSVNQMHLLNHKLSLLKLLP